MGDYLNTLLTALHDNISAVFALAGVVLGALLSFLGSHILERREAKHRVTEKVLNRRIKAHEEVARWAGSLEDIRVIGYYENDEKEVATPGFMFSPDAYTEWKSGMKELVTGRYAIWLSAATDEEMKIFGIYLRELEDILHQGYIENIWVVGAIVYDDFYTFMARIQNACLRYLAGDLLKLDIPFRTVSISPNAIPRRLNQLTGSRLISERQTIERLVRADPREIEQKLPFVLFEYFKNHLQERLSENFQPYPSFETANRDQVT